MRVFWENCCCALYSRGQGYGLKWVVSMVHVGFDHMTRSCWHDGNRITTRILPTDAFAGLEFEMKRMASANIKNDGKTVSTDKAPMTIDPWSDRWARTRVCIQQVTK